MANLLMFASIREASGERSAVIDGKTVGEVLSIATADYGAAFEKLLPYCMVLVDNDAATLDQPVYEDSEVALLPPVSGGQ